MVTIKSTDIFEHIDKVALAPVYLLTGEEGFLIDRALSRLVTRALSGAPRDFNLDVFYARDSRAEDVVAQADTLPMMAERRVVVLKEADRLRDPLPLNKYLESPSEYTTLILVAEDADKAKEAAIAKALPGPGVHVHFYRPFESEVSNWVRILAREAGYTIEGDAAAFIKEALGDDIALIEAELNKLFNYAGERKKVTLDDVKESLGEYGLPLVFDLIDAALVKKTGKALEVLSRLLKDGEQPLMILGMMAQHWRKLLDARERKTRGESDDQLVKALRLTYFNKKGFLAAVSRLSESELAGAFHLFHDADMALKGSALAPGLVMERLVLNLTGAGSF